VERERLRIPRLFSDIFGVVRLLRSKKRGRVGRQEPSARFVTSDGGSRRSSEVVEGVANNAIGFIRHVP